MIIEMILQITEDKTLLAAWEFSEKLWAGKEKLLRKFVTEILVTQHVEFEEKKWQENIVFEIKSKPHQFYEIQTWFNDYFKAMGAKIIVE